MDDLTVVIPVYNEEHSIIDHLHKELTSLGAEVIVVDDGSDKPYPLAIRHVQNIGYGEALVTGIRLSTRPLVMTIDGDGQHLVSECVKLYHAFKLIQDADMLIGFRRVKNEKFIRYIGRKLLNWTASIICTSWINDLNSGARIFRRNIVYGYLPILCRTFSFTTSLTISLMADNHRVEFFPINVKERRYGKSKVKLFKHGFITLKYILWIGLALRTRKIRAWKRNLFSRLTGKHGLTQ